MSKKEGPTGCETVGPNELETGIPAPPSSSPNPISQGPTEANLPFVPGWRIVSVEALGKRAVASCVSCGQAREISLVGGVASCGCGRGARADGRTFAGDIASAERFGAKHRHKGGGL